MQRFFLLSTMALLTVCTIAGAAIPVPIDTAKPAPGRPMPTTSYQQAPPPIIMPGTHLDTNFRSLATQDPAVRRSAPAWLRSRMKGEPTYILDGKVATVSQIKQLRQVDVASITVLEGSKASVLYGPNARQGLLLITTKAGL